MWGIGPPVFAIHEPHAIEPANVTELPLRILEEAPDENRDSNHHQHDLLFASILQNHMQVPLCANKATFYC